MPLSFTFFVYSGWNFKFIVGDFLKQYRHSNAVKSSLPGIIHAIGGSKLAYGKGKFKNLPEFERRDTPMNRFQDASKILSL